ncbi:MAG TPA: type II toxin-antitoxin system death-on-curing family toxin [Thermoanaerobaculia bacterium]|nr:type II toxin-antitoxin system death-on-curing family toxin [Thermoanaerobaculia bacterium]
MDEPVWLEQALVDFIAEDQVRRYGGLYGLRDVTLLESALARPRQRFAYDSTCDLASLAASLGFGLAKNRPYLDANKRVAFMAMYTFLGLNGLSLEAEELEAVSIMLALASGDLSEEEFATWLRLRTVAR